MARRKTRRSRGSFKLPIGVLAGLGVGMAEPIGKALQGRWKEVGDDLSYRYIGYNANSKQFDINGLKQGLLPLIIGALVSRYVGGRSGLNLNQYLRGVPLIKI